MFMFRIFTRRMNGLITVCNVMVATTMSGNDRGEHTHRERCQKGPRAASKIDAESEGGGAGAGCGCSISEAVADDECSPMLAASFVATTEVVVVSSGAVRIFSKLSQGVGLCRGA